TILEAVNDAQTVGANGPARIGSNTRTVLFGRQPLAIDAEGFHALPGIASASARSQIYGVWSTKRGCMDRLVRKVAWKRIPKQKGQSEQIASRHAERRLGRRLNEELNRELQASNANYLQRVRNPLLRLDEWPRRLDFSTTDRELRLVGLHDGIGRLAAPLPPPDPHGQAGVLVRFHESLPNNLAQGLLAGRTLDRDEFERLSLRYLGSVPPELRDDEPKGPWSITFANHAPMTLRIEGGFATITIRGRQFASDVRRFDEPMNVTARYRLDRASGAIQAVRQGELEIFPPDFVPNSGRRLPTRLIGFRNLLKHRFEKLLAPEIVSPGLVLAGPWQRVGKLELTEFEADQGWMLLGWAPSSGDSRLASQTSPR
ncbi:MAG TPA: hypothetical protein VGN42_22905, partial [Pirellulales bacterium]|nr:hypothetical protein [Pirellulales bacterium]